MAKGKKPYPDQHPVAWCRIQLDAIIALDHDRPDALPGSVVSLIKQARALLKQRNTPKGQHGRRQNRLRRALQED